MGFMFCDLHVSLNNPSLGDINSSNLPCLNKLGSGPLGDATYQISRF